MSASGSGSAVKSMDISPSARKRSGYYQYDSADMPFSPPSSAQQGGYLQSLSPFWMSKSSNIMFDITPQGDRSAALSDNNRHHKLSVPDRLVSSSGSHAIDNLDHCLEEDQVVPGSIFAMEGPSPALNPRRLSQSLPATPLTTPATSPHTSPRLARKDRDAEPLTQHSTFLPIHQSNPNSSSLATASINTRWLFHTFLQQTNTDVDVAPERSAILKEKVEIAKRIPEEENHNEISGHFTAPSKPVPRHVRKTSPPMSNRDMNFLAPTSM